MKSESEAPVKDDLGGRMSVKFKAGSSFNEYCSQHIPNYNPDRLEVLAVRVYYGKETAITIFAIDKDRQEGTTLNVDKLPIKKFKLEGNFAKDILPMIEECNFTLTTGNYPLADMEIINK